MLVDPSFEELELTTLLIILDQEYLHISSELDLFMALTRYAEKHDYGKPICKGNFCGKIASQFLKISFAPRLP